MRIRRRGNPRLEQWADHRLWKAFRRGIQHARENKHANPYRGRRGNRAGLPSWDRMAAAWDDGHRWYVEKLLPQLELPGVREAGAR